MNKTKTQHKFYPCPKCGHKTVLASGVLVEFDADVMPYEDNVEEESDIDPISAEVRVGIYFCEQCVRLVDAWIEEPHDLGYSRVCKDLESANRKIAELTQQLKERT